MEKCGVLTADPARGKLAVPTTFAGPTESSAQGLFAELSDGPRPRVRLKYVAAFMVATVRAAMRLRFATLESTVQDVAAKNRISARARSRSQDPRELG